MMDAETEEFLRNMPPLPQPTGADFGWPGWEYRDVPWMTQPLWDKFTAILGEENVKLLAGTRRIVQGDPCVRGQLLISPAGMVNLRAYKPASE